MAPPPAERNSCNHKGKCGEKRKLKKTETDCLSANTEQLVKLNEKIETMLQEEKMSMQQHNDQLLTELKQLRLENERRNQEFERTNEQFERTIQQHEEMKAMMIEMMNTPQLVILCPSSLPQEAMEDEKLKLNNVLH